MLKFSSKKLVNYETDIMIHTMGKTLRIADYKSKGVTILCLSIMLPGIILNEEKKQLIVCAK